MWVKRKIFQEFTRWSHVGNLTYAAHHCLPSKITLNRQMKVQQVHCSRYSLMNTCSNRTPFWQQGACTKHLDNSWNGIKGDFSSCLNWNSAGLLCSHWPVPLPTYNQVLILGPNQPGPTQPCASIVQTHLDSMWGTHQSFFLPLVSEIWPRFTMVSLLMVKTMLHAKFVANIFISSLDFLPWLFFHSQFFRVFIPFQSQHARSPEKKYIQICNISRISQIYLCRKKAILWKTCRDSPTLAVHPWQSPGRHWSIQSKLQVGGVRS